MNSGYGATGGAKDDFGALQFGELPLADRVALLEEYHHDRWRVPREPFPSVRGILDFTSSGRRPRKVF